ncbi:MAG: hypothetical protein ACM31D_03795 [Bacteroidota bacterium]
MKTFARHTRVIPAEAQRRAGIHGGAPTMDARFRGHDEVYVMGDVR